MTSLFRFIRDVLVASGTSGGRRRRHSRARAGLGQSARCRRSRRVAAGALSQNDIESGEIDPKARPRLIHDRAASFVLDGGPRLRSGGGDDGGWHLPSSAPRKSGVCFGLIRETHAYRRDRPLRAVDVQERDCAAIVMGTGPAMMAYHGARVASMATSPIAIAVPSGQGPIVLRLATSTIFRTARFCRRARPGRRCRRERY